MAVAPAGDDKVPIAVPPRKVVPGRNWSQTILRNTDSREVLMGMGFPKNRAYVTYMYLYMFVSVYKDRNILITLEIEITAKLSRRTLFNECGL